VKLHRGLLNWGIFLIALAIIPLAVQWGYLDARVANDLLGLWPLILIAIGIGLILRLTTFEVVGGLLTAAVLGLLGGALIVGGVGSVGGACVGTGSPAALETRSGPFSADSARVDLELTCVDLSVEREPGRDWSVAADFAGSDPPQLDATGDRLTVHSSPRRAFFGGQARRDISIVVPQEPELAMSLTLNAARGTVRLGGGRLSSLSATANASDVRLELGGAVASDSTINLTLNAASGTLALPAESMTAQVSLNAAALDVCIAPDAGLQIDWDARVSGENFGAAGLVRQGDIWQTPGYDTAAVQAQLRVSSNASSVTVHRTGGCP
jgi:hypothetical protein